MGFQRSRFIHILGHFTRLSARSVVYLPWGLFETDLQCLIITVVSVQVNKILKLARLYSFTLKKIIPRD